MTEYIPRTFVFCVLFSALFFVVVPMQGDSAFLTRDSKVANQSKPATILFVGDIMLGRVVENVIDRKGFDYVFGDVKDLILNTDYAVGNFEGVVNKHHVKTKPYTFQFSIKEEYLEKLSDIGFDNLSLANNHSYDFGAPSLTYTRKKCSDYKILCIGDPRELNEYSVSVQKIGDYDIGFIYLHTLSKNPDMDELKKSLIELQDKSEFIIAYIHWGEEYALLHNDVQETLARTMIDLGADTVIGHHPHVVQDLEIYSGKPIFYSLGNFVFDQYFSEEVKQGLLVKIVVSEDHLKYNLIGIKTPETSTRPEFMSREELGALISRIIGDINHTLKDKIVVLEI
jgi:poly-gamma-glutamate synthesis protein (capsule biosynthesis protein)